MKSFKLTASIAAVKRCELEDDSDVIRLARYSIQIKSLSQNYHSKRPSLSRPHCRLPSLNSHKSPAFFHLRFRHKIPSFYRNGSNPRGSSPPRRWKSPMNCCDSARQLEGRCRERSTTEAPVPSASCGKRTSVSKRGLELFAQKTRMMWLWIRQK